MLELRLDKRLFLSTIDMPAGATSLGDKLGVREGLRENLIS